MTFVSFVVTFKPESTNKDITNFVQSIEWIETGTGEIRSAKLILNADQGAFITNADFTGAGNTPILDEFDRIKIAVTDRNSVVFTAQYEVDITKPTENTQQGTVLEVQLLGPEHHLLRMPFVKPFFFENAFTVVRDAIDIYNDQKADLQPTISDHDNTTGNKFPEFTSNAYTFHLTEQMVYEGIKKTADRMGSSVAAGGGGDFFEFSFIHDAADLNNIKLRSFISGVVNSGVTITDSTAFNPAEQEGGIESTRATVSATWGANNFGSSPTQTSKFAGALEAWRLSRPHKVGLTYPANSIVRQRNTGPDSQGDELHHKSNKSTSTTPPATETSSADWDSYNFLDFLTNEISISGQYSPMTNARDDGWKNSGANPDGTQNDDPPLTTSLYVWDGNQVVFDGTFFRTWVDVRALNEAAVPDNYKYNPLTTKNFHRGFRVLVDGVGTDEFAGNDNNILRHNGGQTGTAADWDVFRVTSNDEFVCVDDEAKVYKKSGGTWADDSNNSQANDAYHPIASISNVAGHNKKNNGAGGTFGDNSAVRYESRFSKSDVTALTSRSFYRMGAWINLKFPFPHSSFNAETIGSVFGSATKFEPATLDTNNMHFSPNGNVGFNHSQSDEYGQMDGIKFMTRFQWRYQKDGSGSLVRAGNFPCKCFMYDSSDNVVSAEFTIGHNDNYEMVFIPFTSFKNYRARIPWSLEASGSNVFLQELEILNVFEYKNIQKICFQWQGPYDEDGRFAPFLKINFLFPSLEDIFLGLVTDGFNVKWDIDAFHFSKPQLAVTAPITGAKRAMFARFHQEPLISNRFQLDQANLAHNEIDRFRVKKYEIETEGLFDINFGETYVLSNPFLVNDSDAGANTINLVAKEIRFKIDKPPTGVGGFIRTLVGVKRFV